MVMVMMMDGASASDSSRGDDSVEECGNPSLMEVTIVSRYGA